MIFVRRTNFLLLVLIRTQDNQCNNSAQAAINSDNWANRIIFKLRVKISSTILRVDTMTEQGTTLINISADRPIEISMRYRLEEIVILLVQ